MVLGPPQRGPLGWLAAPRMRTFWSAPRQIKGRAFLPCPKGQGFRCADIGEPSGSKREPVHMRRRTFVPWWACTLRADLSPSSRLQLHWPRPTPCCRGPFLPATASRTRTPRGPRKRNISATAGMDRAGGSKLRGLQGIISTTKRGLRDGARRVPDGGSQSPHLDRRVPCRVCGFRRFQSNRPIASAYGVVWVRIYTMPVREFFGADLSVLVVLSTAVIGLAAFGVAILWNR